jgi:hypothetical protein
MLETIHKRAEDLFEKRGTLLSLWQEIADNFYPERADFTITRNLGSEFADHLMTGFPVMARRELQDSIGAMLRPSSKEWMKVITQDYDEIDVEARAWLERSTGIMKRAMYDPKAMFQRATKSGDGDYAAFGQCVLSVQLNPKNQTLLYRNWHLRDVAWMEDEIGQVAHVYRKWKPKAIDLFNIFGDNIHTEVKKKLEKEPYCEIECMHCVIPSSFYQGKKKFRQPFVSIFYDVKNMHEMEVTGSWNLIYAVPRWQLVSGSQYAYSPASVIALPDGRLLQTMTRVLIEAGEKATNPPMVAVMDAIRSDIAIYAGGVTAVDAEYDERLGEVLRPLTQDRSGIPLGLEMQQDVRNMLKEAFFLNKISLPPPEREMTAFETGQRVQEYIRQALPLFEPLESEYNGAVCELTFDILMRAGAFGSPYELPKSLRGQDIQFQFESPLRDATERAKGQRLLEASQMLAQAASIDQSAVSLLDIKTALRDVFTGIGVPAKWTRSEAKVKEMEEQQQAAIQQQQMLSMLEQGSNVAKNLNDAGKQ